MKSKKGSSFERDVCRLLSKWWTGGKRDDVFWRTAGSGARATVRSKKNKETFGSYGDITAIDPVGVPFTDVFMVELKCGYSDYCIFDLLDKEAGRPVYQDWIRKTINTWKVSGTFSWMLIHRRNRRQPIVVLPTSAMIAINERRGVESLPISPRLHLYFQSNEWTVVPLQTFLAFVQPSVIQVISREC